MTSLISFGPTAVDSFDYYRENDKPFDAYLLELTTWMQPNDAMKRGTAFEQSLYAAFDGAEFGWEVATDVDMTLTRPSVRQMPVTRTYQDSEGSILVNGYLDGAYGMTHRGLQDNGEQHRPCEVP